MILADDVSSVPAAARVRAAGGEEVYATCKRLSCNVQYQQLGHEAHQPGSFTVLEFKYTCTSSQTPMFSLTVPRFPLYVDGSPAHIILTVLLLQLQNFDIKLVQSCTLITTRHLIVNTSSSSSTWALCQKDETLIYINQVYLRTLSLAPIIERRKIERLVRKPSRANLRHSQHLKEHDKKTQSLSHDSWFPGLDMNPEPWSASYSTTKFRTWRLKSGQESPILGALAQQFGKVTVRFVVYVCPHCTARIPLDGLSRRFASEISTKKLSTVQTLHTAHENLRTFMLILAVSEMSASNTAPSHLPVQETRHTQSGRRNN